MASDTAALVVALSAQVSKFEKDMKDAVKVADTRTKEIETRFSQMNRNIEAEFSSFVARYTSQAGTIGNILTGLGPVGTTIAAGIGAATLALGYLTDQVEKFVQKQVAMREAAETTGLTLDQLKVLGQIATKTGVDFEKAERGVLRMVVAVDELRSKGTGPLADELNKIDPQLTKQVITAKNVAEAIELLASALEESSDKFKQAGLASDLFGKRNIEVVRIFRELARSGGFGPLVEANKALGKSVDEDLNQRLVQTQRQIDAIKKSTTNLFGTAGAEFQKGAQLDLAKAMENVGKFTLIASNYMSQFVAAIKDYIATKPGVESTNKELENLRMPGLTQPFNRGGAGTPIRVPLPPDVGPISGIPVPGLPLPQARPAAEIDRFIRMTEELDEQKKLLAQNITFMERWSGVLGDAIKPAEQYQIKQNQINKALQDYAPESEEAIKLQEAGARSLERLALNQTVAAIAVREHLGVATQQELLTARLIPIIEQYNNGILTQADYERARAKAVDDSRKAYENMIIASSRVPDLTRFAIEGQDALKQFSQVAINSFGAFENAIADVAVGASSLEEAFKKMADSIIRDLIRMTIRLTITAPLAQALSGMFNAGGGGLGNIFANSGNPFGKAAGGPVQAGQPYVVGEKGPELFVPGQSGTIVPSQLTPGRSMGGSTVEINNYVAADTETRQSQQQGPDGERIVVDIVRKASARGDFDAVNRGRFGLRAQKVR